MVKSSSRNGLEVLQTQPCIARKLLNNVFSVIFMCLKPVFVLFNVSNKQFKASDNIPPLRRKVVVTGNGNCFIELLLFRGMK